MNILKAALVALATLPSFCFAQIDGANVFGTNQVITVELSFSQTNFWDSLTANYDSSIYMSGDLVVTDNTGIHTFLNVGVRLKGNSSYSHPGDKKSFKIDFNKYEAGQNYDGLKKLNFSNAFKDPSFIREKLFFDVCKEAGVPAPRANYADVWMNNEHWGFYTLVEQIDDQFLDWAIEDDAGNMFKAGDNFGGGPGGGTGEAADLAYYGNSAADYGERYELKTNEAANDWTDFIELLDFINNTSDAQFRDQFNTYFEQEELLRGFALDNLFSNLDSYLNSARNYYLYHNLTTGKWEWIKWDGNETFGSYTGGEANLEQLEPDYAAASRPLLERIMIDDSLYAAYEDQFCLLTEQFFNSAHLDPMIDDLVTMIAPFVYADENKMYSDMEFDSNITSDITSGGGPMGGTIFGIKSFIDNRSTFMGGAIDCSQFVGIVEAGISQDILLYPNPTSGPLSIEFEEAVSGNIDLALYDVQGRLITRSSVPGLGHRLVTFDLGSMDPGIYLLEVREGNLRLMERIILQ